MRRTGHFPSAVTCSMDSASTSIRATICRALAFPWTTRHYMYQGTQCRCPNSGVGSRSGQRLTIHSSKSETTATNSTAQHSMAGSSIQFGTFTALGPLAGSGLAGQFGTTCRTSIIPSLHKKHVGSPPRSFTRWAWEQQELADREGEGACHV